VNRARASVSFWGLVYAQRRFSIRCLSEITHIPSYLGIESASEL